MCGIAGYYGLQSNPELLQKMNAEQAHRGPDGEDTFIDGVCGLAHRRLAILDIEHGDQPMTTADGRHTIAYNGEVYNYLDLRSELEELGREFVTDCDTEVVLQAYAEWGTAAFDKFNGMFAIAIWDSHTQSLTLARDHFGIKPLYLCAVDGGHLFASEIKPILASGLYERKPNERTIYRYLKFRIHEDGNETFFDGIERLAPGEYAILGPDGVERGQFTRLKEELLELAENPSPYTKATAEEYREKLTEAIRLRLQSEVPVGTSLSGGLDSSAVAVSINKLINEGEKTTTASVGTRQNTFSAVFPKSINDEERYVDAVLDSCAGHVRGHKIKPTTDDFKADLQDFVRTQEEPLVSSGPYAQFQVMREATKHVTVLLDGQGADEMMAGYDPYYYVYLRQLRREDRGAAFGELTTSLDIFGKLARHKATSKLKRHIAPATMISADMNSRFAEETFPVENNHLKKRLVQDLFHNSLPSLLRYEDKNTMRFSLEGRVPFLDKEVLKFLFSLDNDAIIREGWNKRILRDAMRGTLPDMITSRRNKIGFTTPEGEWFERLKNHIHQIFMSEEFGARPYFNAPAVAEAFAGWVKGSNDVPSMTFWRFLNVELWLREFFDEPVEEPEAPAVKESDYVPNQGKFLNVEMPDGTTARRYPIRTERFSADDDLDGRVLEHVDQFFANLPEGEKWHFTHPWHLFVSEKIVAITQGRSYFLYDIKVGAPARVLSRFVSRTPAGIGLGSPFTMQLAIQEAGLGRIMYAAAGSALGKLVGRKGLFYDLAGNNVKAIDGPTEYSVYPANVSAKLAPRNPDMVAGRLSEEIMERVPEPYRSTFVGTVIIDANDLGRDILGNDARWADEQRLAEMFSDNPLGQGHEQTPLAIVVDHGGPATDVSQIPGVGEAPRRPDDVLVNGDAPQFPSAATTEDQPSE